MQESEIDWEQMSLANGYLFGTVMKNERISTLMLERLLGVKKISKITASN